MCARDIIIMQCSNAAIFEKSAGFAAERKKRKKRPRESGGVHHRDEHPEGHPGGAYDDDRRPTTPGGDFSENRKCTPMSRPKCGMIRLEGPAERCALPQMRRQPAGGRPARQLPWGASCLAERPPFLSETPGERPGVFSCPRRWRNGRKPAAPDYYAELKMARFSQESTKKAETRTAREYAELRGLTQVREKTR